LCGLAQFIFFTKNINFRLKTASAWFLSEFSPWNLGSISDDLKYDLEGGEKMKKYIGLIASMIMILTGIFIMFNPGGFDPKLGQSLIAVGIGVAFGTGTVLLLEK